MAKTAAPPPAAQVTSWHALDGAAAAERLHCEVSVGLTQSEAESRLQQVGSNELVEGKRISPVVLFLRQFTSPLVLVLLAAAGLSALLHDPKDSLVIGVILIVNGVIGFVQEYRADQSMQALRRLSLPRVRVRRDGRESTAEVTAVVPGDIVLLQAGDLVPADARAVVAANLRVDEAPLTGESEPVDKVAGALPAELPLAERANMLYRGTSVVYGRGEALVVATGMQTELGAIAAALGAAEETETPLQRRLASLGKSLALWALGLCAVIMAVGLLRGEPWREMLMTAVALAVAAIPEGLPAVVTVALALGARRMARRAALVRSLPAVEGLGSVTVICTDKTGTLTRNEMTVTHLLADGGEWEVTGVGCHPVGELRPASPGTRETAVLRRLLVAGALCNDAALQYDPGGTDECEALGDPTEVALLTVAVKGGEDPAGLRRRWPRVQEAPFDSERKRMATRHESGGDVLVAAKGSPETLLPVCTRAWWEGREQPLGEALREHLLEHVRRLAGQGRRVLAVAERRGPVPEGQQLDADLTFLGLVGIIDPPRPEAAQAVAECHSAGIRTVMITGDHKLTAQAIARELGMLEAGGAALSGTELDTLSPEAFVAQAEQTAVFARVTPEHKLRLVRALQERGQVVAMTGDGVNDAPALRQADIGVAMGRTGTDVAREASRLVLADDNFATIVAAVREGRVIYDNMRKFLRFLLNTNLAEILVMFIALVLGWPVPLLALQILWINLVTDGLPALALGFEPPDRDIMRRPPRDPRQSIFTSRMTRGIALNAVVMALVVVLTMRLGSDLTHQRTIAFTSLALAQLANCLACRSERRLLWEIGALSNPHMIGSVLVTTALQLAVVYVPFLQRAFQTVALSPLELAECLGASAAVFLAAELEKLVYRLSDRQR